MAALPGPHREDNPVSEDIRREFARMFANWEIELPDEDVRSRRSGEIREGGWRIQYHFGEEAGREFIELLASHRMTNDRLIRIYADGERELVGASLDLLAGFTHATQDMEEGFYEMVKERGFEV